jgi:hypothetical protein
MKLLNKLSVRIVAAIVIGFLITGAGISNTYSCAPIDGAAGCVSFDKVVMHPNDLLHNRQNSLVRFSSTFAITSLVAFALLNVVRFQQKKTHHTTHPSR